MYPMQKPRDYEMIQVLFDSVYWLMRGKLRSWVVAAAAAALFYLAPTKKISKKSPAASQEPKRK